MAINFFNIGKANAKIAELETQLAAASENSTAVEARAEQLQAEVKAAKDLAATEKARADKAEAAIAAANDRATKAEGEAKVAVDAQKDFDAKVAAKAEAIGSQKAGAIVAEVGHPAVKVKTESDPAKPEGKANLKGRERLAAAIKAQIESK